MKPISAAVFRAYDIRGVVDADFDEQWVEVLGRALGTWFRGRGWDRAVVGQDARHSSPAYCDALVRGLCSAGVDVIAIGSASTPLFYHAVRRLNCRAGVMVTASHNPPEYNGFKLWGGATTLSPDEIQEVRGVMERGAFASGNGLASRHDPLPGYLEDLAARLPLAESVKVVVDGGNGSSGNITANLLEKAGAEVVRLYCDPDGDFPNHHPDPVIEDNARDLMARVPAEGAAFGVGLDGDGDRVGVVDETGRLLDGDRLTAILARRVLSETPGATVIGDVKCSHLLFQDIEAHGGKAVMGVTGHSIMKTKMLETGAALGGEMSGHIFFGELGGADDASYAALMLAGIVSRNPHVPVSDYLADWPETVSTPELRLQCPEQIKFQAVALVTELFREGTGRGSQLIDMDGARVVYPDGWALVRASNTQPVVVMRFEAESESRLKEIRRTVEKMWEQAVNELSGGAG